MDSGAPAPATSQYKVVTVNPGCCATNVSPSTIERECNNMANQGYTLAVGYEAMVGCGCCPNKAAVLVFVR
jgi:hypothetical protein